MPANKRQAVAASGQVPVDYASQQASSAAAATGLQAGVGAEVAAPATPPGRTTFALLGSVGATASTCARRYRGKRPPPSLAAEATPHGGATQCRLRDQNSPNRFRLAELYFKTQEQARSACSTLGCRKDAACLVARLQWLRSPWPRPKTSGICSPRPCLHHVILGAATASASGIQVP